MDKIKTLVITICSAVTSFFGALAVPVYLLVLCNVIDYGTGIAASGIRGEKISSYKGMKGIVKKVGMWILVLVGAIMDTLLLTTGQSVGLVLPFRWTVAIIVAIWLTFNELISILENLHDIGVPMPAFLLKLAKYIEAKVEKQGDDLLPEGEEDGECD